MPSKGNGRDLFPEISFNEQVARIEERVDDIHSDIFLMTGEDPVPEIIPPTSPHDPPSADIKVAIARIDERTKMLAEAMKDVEKKLSTRFVTIEEFRPVKMVAFGFVGTILMAVIAAILALVLR